MIIEQLTAIQASHGYLPRDLLVGLAQRLALPLYRIEEVASFYPHFRKSPPPDIQIHVCRDMSCALRGAQQLTEEIETALGAEIAAEQVQVSGVSCLGRCDRAPATRLDQQPKAHSNQQHTALSYLGRSSSQIVAAARSLLDGATTPTIRPDLDADQPDKSSTWKIDIYSGRPREDRYQAVRQVLHAISQGAAAGGDMRDRIIQDALKNAVLLGMGGAGGQAFKKWCEVREAVGERKYVVCNADESEPGTFKDRELLLRTPHLVVEGVLLAGIVLGAQRGYIYIRHEYEECIDAARAEIEWARRQGLCGQRLLGTDVSIEVEVFVSPGGYICGEQTALIEAIQDKRAEPRNRPPELQTNGLWDMPTLVNNVETLAWAPAIVLHEASGKRELPGIMAHQSCRAMERAGPATDQSWYGTQGRPFGELAKLILAGDSDWQRRHGVAQHFPGVRIFSISGDVHHPGVYEVENGISIGELLEQAGGIRDGRPLKAIALSGPSGGFTPAKLPRASWPRKIQATLSPSIKQVELVDLQMHINYFRSWDLMLGAGIVVYNEDADLVAQALACLRFFQAESCGKCVPCRVGSTRLAEIGADLAGQRLTPAQLTLLASQDGPLADLALTMASTAICGLGTVAPNPLTSLLRYFPDEISNHLNNRVT